MENTIDPKCVFVRLDAFFCCKCHGYNKALKLDIEVPPDYVPKSTNRECYNCGNVTRVGTTGKELV